MRKIRRLALGFIMVVVVMSMGITAFADEIEPSDAVITREDISIEEAMSNPSFSMDQLLVSEKISKSEGRGINSYDEPVWSCWGSRGLDSSSHMYYPIGYSVARIGGVAQPTYHYTRTFLGSTWSPRGDSGYCWGTYTVRADGTPCTQEVWNSFTHHVYYGLPEDL